jgi:hypothetical protein
MALVPVIGVVVVVEHSSRLLLSCLYHDRGSFDVDGSRGGDTSAARVHLIGMGVDASACVLIGLTSSYLEVLSWWLGIGRSGGTMVGEKCHSTPL